MSEFSQHWFDKHIPLWTRLLRDLRGQPIRALEVGSFEGRSALWLLKNVLTHPDAHLVCVDPHAYTEELAITSQSHSQDKSEFDIALAQQRFLANTALYRPAKLTYLQYGVVEGLREIPFGEQFGLAYIDGSHIAAMVLHDAVHVWPYVEPGGIVIFDDYQWRWNKIKESEHLWRPKLGIDAFLNVFETRYELLHKNYQVAVRKIA